ncbi:MAG: tetratricopeptide repeat protein, partial [Chloroflexota bacterium]
MELPTTAFTFMERHLVPHYILEKMAMGETNGRFRAVTLFVDSSGFTPLTSALMRHGTVGAELIAEALQRIFAPLVQMVHEQGGFIAGFAGDAFKGVFLLEGEAEWDVCQRVLQVAQQIRAYVLANATQKTDYGDFDLVVKASVGLGEVTWSVWQATESVEDESQQAVYTFSGAALADCMDADAYAEAGDILLTTAVYETIPEVLAEAVGGYFRVLKVRDRDFNVGRVATRPTLDGAVSEDAGSSALATRFFAADLLRSAVPGEFRQVVTMFANIKSLPAGAETDRFFDQLFKLLGQYQGYLCRVGQIGDKDRGMTLLFFWGAPMGHENDQIRALNFAVDLRALVPSEIRIGISSGMAFAGFVGGRAREEYTCYGAAVTLAARQMVSAPWGAVWLDEEMARRGGALFRLTLEGERLFKGYETPRPVYQLHHRQSTHWQNATTDAFYEGALVGRKRELAQLKTAVSPIFNGRFAGVAVVQGEAGLGKSRLIHTVERHVPQARWALCQTDEILRQSLNPFRYFLRTFFKQDVLAGEGANKAAFRAVLVSLRAATPDAALREALQRTDVFLGALLNLYWPDSLYQQLEPKLRFGNSLEALKNFFKALSLQQPLVIHLEDAQWLDSDSRTFLAKLLHNIEPYPIAVIISTRERLARDAFAAEVAWTAVQLEPLRIGEVAEFITEFLGKTAVSDVIITLRKRTDGNPFFMEQMLLYWRENNLLEATAVGIGLRKNDEAVPTDVRSILIARIDSLIQTVKEVVLTAAILGREFEMQVLTRMRHADSFLLEKVQQAEHAAIWLPLNELRYLFRHALLRDAAYEMQLLSQRRTLHQLAAEAIEQFHQANLTLHYADLAYHYDQAGMGETAVRWYQLAGDAAAEQFANENGLDYLSRALAIVGPAAIEQRYQLLCSRERVYQHSGQRDAQKGDIEALVALMAKLTKRQQIEVKLREANFAELIADYELMKQKSEESILLAEAGRFPLLMADGYHHLGAALWPLENYQATASNLQRGLEIAREETAVYLEADILNTFGTYAEKHGDSRTAVSHHQAARDLFGQLNNLSKYSAATNNLGIALMSLGEIEEATQCFQEASDIYRRTGNRSLIASTMGNLGIISRTHGDYERAAVSFQIVLEEFIETKERWAAAMAYLYLGMTALDLGDFAVAAHNAQMALTEFQAIKHKPSEGRALTLLGSLMIHLGQYAAAEQRLEQAEARFVETESSRDLGRIQTLQGWLARRRGDFAQAETMLQKSVAILQELEDRGLLAQAWLQ